MTRNIAIAFIGFGEVGQLFARQLREEAGVAVSAYDLKFDDPAARPSLAQAALSAGVHVAGSARAAAAGADVVFSAVTASSAEDVAIDAAGWLAEGQVLVDLNSASPDTKRRCALALDARGRDFVEAAVMAPVAQPGIRVPILTGGRRAAEVSELLNGLGFQTRAVSDTVGRASATKLCRSIVIKGLEALMIDCARASAHWQVQDDVFASLGETFPSIDFRTLAQVMDQRVARHGLRRAAEMREAAAMLAEMGLDPTLSRAIADCHERRAKA
jgi:3-hydroxyisobutyrate dehydrogenase-like beta-hydroxyacid dehydrogenase